ncbi:hypothetical protein WMF18_41700 [Sorangium sp. So ce315]|uniref:hypothetical protein n=1 Tax=Sorangium sp. So ce315 TaxID=3133299 RepID=UPI003F64772A
MGRQFKSAGPRVSSIRHAEISWTLVPLAGAALLPLVVRHASSLGRISMSTSACSVAVQWDW